MAYPNAYVMIEFVLGNRRLRLYPDGKITCRAILNGEETIKEIWNDVSFFKNKTGYLQCTITVDGVYKKFLQHRLLHLARNPGWDIFDTSPNNCIDHRNHTRDDNADENLRVVTHQQNSFNKSNTKGYSWNKRCSKWQVSIMLNYKNIHLGYFVNEEDAAAAYLKAKARLHVIPES